MSPRPSSAPILILIACQADPTPSLAEELGITDLLGTAQVVETSEIDGATAYTFGGDRTGCLRGDPFSASTLDRGSSDLIVFLQGGGACWSDFCFAVTGAPLGVPSVDLLNPDIPDNPVANWNVVYLPYCDGSLFAGDRDHDDDGDGEPDRMYRGLANLSAALDVAAQDFPEPRRVLLAGSSGGGFGTILATSLVRHVWPDAALKVLNDSGVGVARGAADPGYVDRLVDEFGADRFIPEDCPDCLAGGHIAPLVDWTLERDPEIQIAAFSSWYDAIISEVFLDVSPVDFQASLEVETGRTHVAFPERYRRFFIDGRMHTTVLGDPSGIVGTDLSKVEIPPEAFARLTGLSLGRLHTTAIGDHRFVDWLDAFLREDTTTWVDRLAPATPPDADPD